MISTLNPLSDQNELTNLKFWAAQIIKVNRVIAALSNGIMRLISVLKSFQKLNPEFDSFRLALQIYFVRFR